MRAYGPTAPYSRLRRSTGILLCEASPLRGYCALGAKGKDMTTPRRKMPKLKVYCLEEERAAIEEKAAQAGLSLSSYLRTVGLGQTVYSAEDLKLAQIVLRTAADMGRISGLLKALLSNDERFDGPEGEKLQRLVLESLEQSGQLKSDLRAVAEKVLVLDEKF